MTTTFSAPAPLLDVEGIARLREALSEANYIRSYLIDRLAPIGADLNIQHQCAVLAELSADEPAIALLRLFGLAGTLPVAQAEAALNPLPLADALAAGLVGQVDGGVRAEILLVPLDDDFWLASDVPLMVRRRPGLSLDHVLGSNPSTDLLARLTVRRPVDTALDLGTGSGIQAIHLSGHAARTTATDISARALRFAATNAALNGLDWELLQGDLAEPVSGRQFDLVVSNPPFVVTVGEPQHLFRDSGREADGLCAELIATAPKLLAPGGTMQFMSNWLHVAGQPVQERLAGWVAGTGLDAWFIQFGQTDPLRYVTRWISSERPAGLLARAAAWLDWFKANKVKAIGVGLVTLRAGGHRDPIIRAEQLVLPPGQLGDDLLGWFDRCDQLRAPRGRNPLDALLRPADGLTVTEEAKLGPGGWATAHPVLSIDSGLHWKTGTTSDIATLLREYDGSQPVREYINRLATGRGLDPVRLAGAFEPAVRGMVELGFLVPGDGL